MRKGVHLYFYESHGMKKVQRVEKNAIISTPAEHPDADPEADKELQVISNVHPIQTHFEFNATG